MIRKVIGVVVQDGDRRGMASCHCGCEFTWNQRTDENIIYKMHRGALIILIRCPQCGASVDGPTV